MIKKYVPIAGLLVEEALINAVKMARKENVMVMAVINDIVMCVDKDTSAVKALKEYYSKLYIKHWLQQYANTAARTRRFKTK